MKLFLDDTFNRSLYEDCLGLESYRTLDQRTGSDGVMHWRAECVPRMPGPEPLRRFLGEQLSYALNIRYSPAKQTCWAQMVPKLGARSFDSHTALWAEPRSDKSCERIVSVNLTVKTLGIGRLIEKLIEQQTRVAYDRVAEFTNDWIRRNGL